MRPLAKSALIGTTISLSLTWALLSMIPPEIVILIWIMIPGFLLAWGASGMLGRMPTFLPWETHNCSFCISC
jgi:hypothetical protein